MQDQIQAEIHKAIGRLFLEGVAASAQAAAMAARVQELEAQASCSSPPVDAADGQ